MGAEGAGAIFGGPACESSEQGLDNIPRPYSKVAEELSFLKVDGLRRSFSLSPQGRPLVGPQEEWGAAPRKQKGARRAGETPPCRSGGGRDPRRISFRERGQAGPPAAINTSKTNVSLSL